MNTLTATINEVTREEGTSKKTGKPYTKFSVVTAEGVKLSTFDKVVAEAAHSLIGQPAQISWKPSGDTGRFKDIIGAEPVVGAAAITNGHGAPFAPPPRSDDAVLVSTPAATNWDEIGLRKTRCLLWAEFLGGTLAATIPSFDEVYRIGVDLITKAERDIYWRPPADEYEDIPFG